MTNVRTQLEAWGAWSRNPGLRLNYVCPLAVIIAHNVGNTIGGVIVSDAEAGRVEHVMCLLKARKPETYSVLFDYYVRERSTREIAKGGKQSERKVFDILKAGEAWVDGALAQGEGAA